MNSERWLANEARWAREQQLKAQRRIDDLRDPRLLERERRDAAARVSILRWEYRRKIAEAYAAVTDLSAEHIEGTIAAAEADRDRWQQLAEGHEARLLNTADEALEGLA